MFKRLFKRKRYFNISYYLEGAVEKKNGASSAIQRFGSIPMMHLKGGVPSRAAILQQLMATGEYKEITWFATLGFHEFKSKADYLEFQQ